MMTTFSRQGFLNAATSPDSGYYKFSLKKSNQTPGRVTVCYRVADCSQHIELDFGTYGVFDPDEATNAKIRLGLAEIKERRRKMQSYAKVVADFAEKYDAALAEAYEDLNSYL